MDSWKLHFIPVGPAWLTLNKTSKLRFVFNWVSLMPSCGAVNAVSTLRHVIQHVKTAQSQRGASAFPFKQLLHTPWSFRGRKRRPSKFTVAHWPTQEMWCKRFRRPGHMTRAGSVDGKGETGGLKTGMVRVRSTGCLFFNETYQTQFVYFIFLLWVSAPKAVCGFPPYVPMSCALIGCSCHCVQSLFRQLEIEGVTWTSRVAPPTLITLKRGVFSQFHVVYTDSAFLLTLSEGCRVL